MKSYTDIDQSKKLVEILPLESADMYYSNDYTEPKIITKYDISFAKVLYGSYNIRFFKIYGNTPCWSLAALLDILNCSDLKKENDRWYCDATIHGISVMHGGENNPVDVCVEMIIKLNEQNLLVK